MANKLLHIRIISPQKTIFEGEAVSLSSKNSEGKFDILVGHANFITLLQNTPITIRLPEKVINFTFPLALLFTTSNQINIYTEI